jgi:hypothetical protein
MCCTTLVRDDELPVAQPMTYDLQDNILKEEEVDAPQKQQPPSQPVEADAKWSPTVMLQTVDEDDEDHHPTLNTTKMGRRIAHSVASDSTTSVPSFDEHQPSSDGNANEKEEEDDNVAPPAQSSIVSVMRDEEVENDLLTRPHPHDQRRDDHTVTVRSPESRRSPLHSENGTTHLDDDDAVNNLAHKQVLNTGKEEETMKMTGTNQCRVECYGLERLLLSSSSSSPMVPEIPALDALSCVYNEEAVALQKHVLRAVKFVTRKDKIKIEEFKIHSRLYGTGFMDPSSYIDALVDLLGHIPVLVIVPCLLRLQPEQSKRQALWVALRAFRAKYAAQISSSG